MEHINTFEFHKNNPDESVEKYVKRKRIELSNEIRFSKKIYLDTKYWILLRDARIRDNVDCNLLQLLHLIESLVENGRAICPISDDIFFEMLKQTDLKTLKATAQLMDDLSKGVLILSLQERLDLEVSYFVRIKTKGIDYVYSLDEMVWTKIAYVCGFTTPSSKVFPPDIDRTIQKAFVDQMWVIGLVDMLEQMGQNIVIPPPSFAELSKILTQNKIKHINDHTSFKQLFLAELGGILDLYKPNFQSLMVYLYELEIGRKVAADEISSDDAGQLFANRIYQAFQLNKITSELPSFHVMAKIHAATRWDKNRILKPNDIYDIHHAVDAIPYCDYFLTERSLKHLVSNKNLGFDSIFHYKTISDIDNAISELSQIPSSKQSN